MVAKATACRTACPTTRPVTGDGVSSGTDKYLIVCFGESNSGGYALNTDAAAWEIASRDDVMMWNVSTDQFENLDIGTNNNLDHAGLSSTTHGWELGLANRVRQGYFDRPVYYLQTGQGGSKIADWNVGGTYWTKYLARTAAVKAAISNYESVVWLTLGINDAIAGTATSTFKSGLEEIIGRIKTDLPGCKIYIANLPSVNATYDAYSTAIAELVAADTDSLRLIDVLTPSALPYRDTNHWSYAGMKRLAARFVASMSDDFPLTPMSLTFTQRDDSGFVYVTAVDQSAYVTESWGKDDFPNLLVDYDAAGQSLVVVMDDDVNAITWSSATNDDYFAGAFFYNGKVYGTLSNNQLSPVSAISDTRAWLRFAISGNDIVVDKSIDGGQSWSAAHTYTNAVVSASTIRIKSLSAGGAAQVDVWVSQ